MLGNVTASTQGQQAIDIVGVLVGIDVQRRDVMCFEPPRNSASSAAVAVPREARPPRGLPPPLVERGMVTAAGMPFAHGLICFGN